MQFHIFGEKKDFLKNLRHLYSFPSASFDNDMLYNIIQVKEKELLHFMLEMFEKGRDFPRGPLPTSILKSLVKEYRRDDQKSSVVKSLAYQYTCFGLHLILFLLCNSSFYIILNQ